MSLMRQEDEPCVATTSTETDGQEFTENGSIFDCDLYNENGYRVISIMFLNQGTNSAVQIRVGSADVTLPPGQNSSSTPPVAQFGASLNICASEGYYLSSKYRITFQNAALGEIAQQNLLVVLIQKTKACAE